MFKQHVVAKHVIEQQCILFADVVVFSLLFVCGVCVDLVLVLGLCIDECVSIYERICIRLIVSEPFGVARPAYDGRAVLRRAL